MIDGIEGAHQITVVKVHSRVARIVGLVRLAGVFGPEALLTGPGFDQRAVHGEMLRADQLPAARLFHRLVEKLPSDLAIRKRSRFLVNTVSSHTVFSPLKPTNHRYSKL